MHTHKPATPCECWVAVLLANSMSPATNPGNQPSNVRSPLLLEHRTAGYDVPVRAKPVVPGNQHESQHLSWYWLTRQSAAALYQWCADE